MMKSKFGIHLDIHYSFFLFDIQLSLTWQQEQFSKHFINIIEKLILSIAQ